MALNLMPSSYDPSLASSLNAVDLIYLFEAMTMEQAGRHECKNVGSALDGRMARALSVMEDGGFSCRPTVC